MLPVKRPMPPTCPLILVPRRRPARQSPPNASRGGDSETTASARSVENPIAPRCVCVRLARPNSIGGGGGCVGPPICRRGEQSAALARQALSYSLQLTPPLAKPRSPARLGVPFCRAEQSSRGARTHAWPLFPPVGNIHVRMCASTRVSCSGSVDAWVAWWAR